MTKLRPQELDEIAGHTLDHYNEHAESFWHGTRDHDVRQNIGALLRHIENEPPYTILDFGCGPGRDLKTFTELGHLAFRRRNGPCELAERRDPRIAQLQQHANGT